MSAEVVYAMMAFKCLDCGVVFSLVGDDDSGEVELPTDRESCAHQRNQECWVQVKVNELSTPGRGAGVPSKAGN